MIEVSQRDEATLTNVGLQNNPFKKGNNIGAPLALDANNQSKGGAYS